MNSFIDHATELIDTKHPCVNFIKYPQSFLRALNELNKMIGMATFKNQIVQLLQYIIVTNYNRIFSETTGSLLDGHMINMVLSGGPGCGKTTAAHYIARIISSMGILEKPPKHQEEEKPPNNLFSVIFSAAQKSESDDSEDEDYIENYGDYEQTSKSRKREIKKLQRELNEEKRKNNKIKTSVSKVINEMNELDISLAKASKFYEINPKDKKDIDRKRLKIRSIQRNLKYETSFTPEEEQKKEEEDKIPFVVYTRKDLIGKYVGHTAIKTAAAIEKNLGGVILIDEAYSLYNDSSSDDSFGEECLTVINEMMSKYSRSLVFVFAGYREKMDKTIFRVQPGLARRIGYTFELDKYSPSDLYEIFKLQVSRYSGWEVSDDPKIKAFFEKNYSSFPDFGGDTEKLSLYAKNESYSVLFSKILEDGTEKLPQIITLDMIERAMSKFHSRKDDKPPFGMYN